MPQSPLTPASLKRAITELEQTAVAVSVMGTTTRKLKEMAALADPVAKSLVGMRPEVHKLRVELHRATHNVRVSSTKAAQASEKLRQLAAIMGRVKDLVTKRLGDVEPTFGIGPFEVVNAWGYSKAEQAPARKALGDAARKLDQVGLPKLAEVKVYLDPEGAGADFVTYRNDDSLVMDLRRQGGPKDVYSALGQRLWRQNFSAGDKETWGDGSGSKRFQEAFADALDGKRLDPDTKARLQVTVGFAV